MKKLITLISPAGKTKKQLVDETYEAMLKYLKVEKNVSNPDNLIEDKTEEEQGTGYQILGAKIPPKKKNKRPYIYMAGIIALALAGYLYFSRTDDIQVIENQQANTSKPVSPDELRELQEDPLAPDWLKNAESCTWVGEKIFCKLKGE